ncbi:MAG: cyclopropane-fatty-acyl-phospholipid synthase family protein [Gemmatimonadales bacterium]
MDDAPGGYDAVYREFDSPLWRRIRRHAYGEDIGQHSWTSAAELRDDLSRLGLRPGRRLLDCGCGPGGALVFLIAESGCEGVGLDRSRVAVELAGARAAAAGLTDRFEARVADLDAPLPSDLVDLDAVVAIDVVIHLRHSERFFAEVATRLRTGGRFLVVDAGVRTGPVTAEEWARRSLHGPTRMVEPGENERLLAGAGLRLVEIEDRTAQVARAARGRLDAYRHHRAELEASWGREQLEGQLAYLETVLALSERRAVSRFAYLTEPLVGVGPAH